jgi:hypothetical protein
MKNWFTVIDGDQSTKFLLIFLYLQYTLIIGMDLQARQDTDLDGVEQETLD